jgi:hypothetical protein
MWAGAGNAGAEGSQRDWTRESVLIASLAHIYHHAWGIAFVRVP